MNFDSDTNQSGGKSHDVKVETAIAVTAISSPTSPNSPTIINRETFTRPH